MQSNNESSGWCRRAPTLGHAPDPPDPLLSSIFHWKQCHELPMMEEKNRHPQFGNSSADFFEPGWKIPLPRSPRADFFEPGSRNPPGAAFGGAPGRFAPWGGGFLEPGSKRSALGDLGRGIFEPGSKKSALEFPNWGGLFFSSIIGMSAEFQCIVSSQLVPGCQYI